MRPDAPSRGGGGGKPLVDVGIPAYRRPRFLTEAIDSVLAQTFDRWRLHISEDGPGTRAVAEAVEPYLRDSRISYSAVGKLLGAAGNKNILLRVGSAPYVAILDHDDRWHPSFLARRVGFLEQHPECGLAFSAVNEIDSEGRRLRKVGFFHAQGVIESRDFVPRLLQGYYVRTPTVLVRRSAYEAVGDAFNEGFRSIYDLEMWFRLGLEFPVGFLPDCDADFRLHVQQSSYGVRIADEKLRFLEAAEPLLARQLWARDFPEAQRRRLRAHWLVSKALDDLEGGDRRLALKDLRQALSVHPSVIRDSRALAALVAVALGRRAGRLIGGAVRDFVQRRRRRRAVHPRRT